MQKRICLLGAGRIGAMHASTVAAHPRTVLHAVADVRESAAKELASRYGGRATGDIESVFGDREIDAFIIATSTDTHVDLILKAARTRKPVFCEKPVDLGLARVDACLAEVRKLGVPLQIGFNRRFDPSFRALHERLRGGEVGKLEIVKITSRDPKPPPMEYVKVSGGLFRDMMIHDFDTARWLLGEEPVSLHATASNLVDPAIGAAGDVDTAVVTMKTKGGVICSIENSRRAVYGYDQRIEVLGDRGMLQAENPLPTTVRSLGGERTSNDNLMYFFMDRYVDAYRHELEHFIEVIEGKQPEVGGNDGRAALVLAEAALESLKSGKSVEVKV
jgi:myo-inositol 2-dehydrogenase / D-chiro-inositol 1-dehydrogenase